MDINSPLPPSPNKQQLSFYHVFLNSYNHHYPPDFFRKVVAEVIATYLLVFMTCGAAAISGSDEHRVAKLGASLVGGMIVTVMIYAVGHISGAHMNPAVTLAFAATTNFPWNQVPIYAMAQVTGAISASFTLRELLQPIKLIGVTSPSGSDTQALIMELVVTFCMMFVTAAVSTDSKAVGELAGIAVGSSVCITSILAGPISGGSMNPARTLGPALASRHYKGLWVYMVGPPLGTLMAALSYNFIRVNESMKIHAISSTRSLSLKRHRKNGDDQSNSLATTIVSNTNENNHYSHGVV